MQRNHLEKIVVSIGVGKLRQNQQFEEKMLPAIVEELGLITGQKAATRSAKKSIATFKLRQGDIVGLVATLRGQRMEDFLKRMVNAALPRVRDFRGIDLKNFDQHGNLTVGFREHTVFPEINAETSKVNFGLEVTLVANTKNKEEGISFFRSLGLPIKSN
ncbi:MAG: 50S ribosomal protein L5 [Patescibacteria group bacterium]|nr:50S ribosomal protein L5 [Patescibacteria group bacterium]MCL5224006.1 50S ribosomal protein L5 [Patescibacteria group bacterium]